MTKKIDLNLSEALVENNVFSQKELDPIIREAEASGLGLQDFLLKHKLCPERDILKILSQKLKIPFRSLNAVSVGQAVIDKIAVKIATYYMFLPLEIKDRVLTIAVSRLLDIKIQDEIGTQLGYEVEIVLATSSDILDGLKKYYGLAADTLDMIMSHIPKGQVSSSDALHERVEDIGKLAEDASVIKLVNQIILEAYRKRATDIHLEPYRGSISLRYRIDGLLYDANVQPQMKQFLNAMISRIKIMSNLNIVERRLPQDGRAVVRVQDQVLDLRISTIPTPYGESVVIRILPTQMLFSLEKLGLAKKDVKIFEGLIQKPHGIIFATGPTGSGKTTTLYACLSRINTKERKIITIEDPIEYEMSGITQIQVAPEIGLDFARGLRSMLRHDPDVMMVGEVRDLETAEIAIRVALTGHLVFSTLHTNDAASGITRLVDIGVEPYLVASSVEAFIAQRLIRVICQECRYEDPNVPLELKELIAKDLGLKSKDEAKVFRSKGCPNCNFSGFFGRTAIYEILLVDEVIKDLILKKASSGQIKKAALSKGMRTLRQDGWQKTILGLTTPEEVMKVTSVEEQTEAERNLSYGNDASDYEPQPQSAGRDKRVYTRLSAKINLRYKLIKSEGDLLKRGITPQQLSATKNISAGGLLFVADEPLALGTILEVGVEIPGEKAIECLAKVVRTEEVGEGNKYDIAVCFLDLTGAERSRLDKYVEGEI